MIGWLKQSLFIVVAAHTYGCSGKISKAYQSIQTQLENVEGAYPSPPVHVSIRMGGNTVF